MVCEARVDQTAGLAQGGTKAQKAAAGKKGGKSGN